MGNESDEEVVEHLSQGSGLVRRNGVVRVRKAPGLTAEEHTAELGSHLCSKYEALLIMSAQRGKERERVQQRDATLAAAREVLTDYFDSAEPRSIQHAMQALRRIICRSGE